jgi:hypothetical protein
MYTFSDKNIQVIKITNKEVKIYIGDEVENQISNIEKKCIPIDYNKKIKAISNFKISEIKNMAEKLNINLLKSNGKKKVKKEIYTEIQQFI